MTTRTTSRSRSRLAPTPRTIGLWLAAVVLVLTAGCRSVQQARAIQSPASMQPGERSLRREELMLAAGTRLTLEAAAVQAVSNSPSVFQARMLLTLAATRWQQARANYLPQIQLSSGYTIDKPYNPTQPSLGAYRGGITLGQELLSFGRQEAELRQAQAEHAATAAQLQAAINTAAYAAHAVYFDLLAAEDALLITEEKVRAFAVHLEQVRVMAELGTRIRYDITKAEVDLGTSRLECLQASNTLHLTRAALGRVLGLTEELPSLRLMWPAAPAVPTEAMPTLFQYARLRHPELIALQALVEAASAAVDWAVADLRPDLSLRASTSGAGHAFPLGWNWSLGPSIAWDAFTGWRKTSALQGATASLQACRSRLTSREQQLFQDLISARIQWQTALAQTMVAESVVQAARESLELVNARYALGLATAVELTDAEVAVAQARTQQVLARRNGLTAWALLCLHTGGSAQREGASL